MVQIHTWESQQGSLMPSESTSLSKLKHTPCLKYLWTQKSKSVMYKSFWSGSNQIVWSLYLGFSSLELTLVMFGAPSPAAITGHLCFVRTGFPGSMALTSQDTVTRLVAVVTGRINELLQRHVVSRVSGGLKQRWSVIRAGLEPCTACLHVDDGMSKQPCTGQRPHWCGELEGVFLRLLSWVGMFPDFQCWDIISLNK